MDRASAPASSSAAVETGRRDPALAVERFVARVRIENQASIRLFERAGFVLRETGTCQGAPCLIFELPP